MKNGQFLKIGVPKKIMNACVIMVGKEKIETNFVEGRNDTSQSVVVQSIKMDTDSNFSIELESSLHLCRK